MGFWEWPNASAPLFAQNIFKEYGMEKKSQNLSYSFAQANQMQ